MAKPLTIYTFVPVGAHASYYYRVTVPLKTASDLGLPVNVIIDRNIEGVSPEERIKNFCEADIIHMYQPIGDGTLHNAKMASSFLPSMREGDWKYPPSFIVDTDDNLFRVDPHNGAFQNLGIRDPQGNMIPKGHSIAHVENGVRRVLWKDGQNGFDVERNRNNLETYRQIVNHADALTTTTPRTAEWMRQECSPRRVEVFPNMVRFDDYPQVHLLTNPAKVRILWQGGANHYLDWLPLREAVGNITKKYKNVHWIMWGVQYPWAMELIPPDRMTFLPWADYAEYKLRRVMIGDDISLAPLHDSSFNQCRSAIKWYEASVQVRPSATLAQNTGPYADEIQDGQTGLLFNTPEEFEEKLSRLIEDVDERKRLGANAKDWVSEHRDAFKEVPKQIKFFEELREQVKWVKPHMPMSAWKEFEARVNAEQQRQAEEQKKQLQPA